MKRRMILSFIVVLVNAGVVVAQPGQVVSYYAEWTGTESDIVPQVPAGGLVVTDVYSSESANIYLDEVVGQTAAHKFRWEGSATKIVTVYRVFL